MLPEDYAPAVNDILCGRGNVFSSHQGNRFFVQIIRDNLQEYMEAKSRPEKIQVVDDILRKIRVSGARFAKLDSKTQRWYELNDVQAHQKIGHAIRDMIRLLGKHSSKISSTSSKSNNLTRKPAKLYSLANQKTGQAGTNSSSVPIRKDAMDAILRINLDTVGFLDDILSSGGSDSININDNIEETTEKKNRERKTGTMTTKASRSLLENEFPEQSFDFSPSHFFEDSFSFS